MLNRRSLLATPLVLAAKAAAAMPLAATPISRLDTHWWKARHEAKFALPDVTVGDYVEPGDVTPSGETAIGVSFNCKTAGCVAAIWGDTPSRADSTDFYVQDVATRDRLRAAFQRLQTP